MNMENSKTNEPHKFVFNVSLSLDLRSSNKHIALQNLSIYYTWKNIGQQYKSNKLKIITPTQNDLFELPDGSYIEMVQIYRDYIEYIIKNHETLLSNVPIYIHINRIINRLVLKIKDGYMLELQTPETNGVLKQLRQFSSNVIQQCNLSEVFYTFTPNKSYTYLLNLELSNLVFLMKLS